MGFAHTEVGIQIEPPLPDGTQPPWMPETAWLPAGTLVEVFPSAPGINCKCSDPYHNAHCPYVHGGWVRVVEGEFAGWWGIAQTNEEHDAAQSADWVYDELRTVTPLELLAQEGDSPPDEELLSGGGE